MDSYDVIVLGAGGVGSAAMYHLARRGLRVLGVDQFRPPHDRGSSHGETRVIRQAYFEHSDYVPLLRESYRLWHELEGATVRRLLEPVGLVEIGPEDGIVVPGVMRAAAEHGLEVEKLTAGAVEQRWPGVRVGEGLLGVYESKAGFLRVEDCVEAHLAAAHAAGAELRIENAIDLGDGAWRVDANDVRVYLRNGPVRASKLVITAGAWAGELLADVLPTLKVLRKSLFWFDAGPQYDVADGMPVYLFELADGVFYGFPRLDGRSIKVAEHTGGQLVESPRTADRLPSAEEQERVARFLGGHLPGVSNTVNRHATCFYTMSPDEHFIVDRHPQHPNVVFAAGLSGHGFKFAPVLGQALADLAVDGGTESPIGFLSLNRFDSK